MDPVAILAVVVVVVFILFMLMPDLRGVSGSTKGTPEWADLTCGSCNAAMVCPHCQEKGTVRTKAVARKRGLSASKATAALLTGGISILATGISRHESLTQAHCDNCGNSWTF
jgi:hypothetical protein